MAASYQKTANKMTTMGVRDWRDEKSVLKKLRVHPDFVVFSPPCEGGAGGVVAARSITTSAHACEAGRVVFDFQGSRPTPPGPPFAREGKGSVTRVFRRSRATKIRVSKPSLQYGRHQLFITPASPFGRLIPFAVLSVRNLLPVLMVTLLLMSGCQHPIPVMGHFQGAANVAAQADVRGEMSIKLPTAIDPGPMVASVIWPARGRGSDLAPRLAVIDVDGVLLNQNREGIYDSGENPVAAFREKLEAATGDSRVAAVVLRIHSPGGGVTACDILAEELDRFKAATRRPVVACLMDVATSGAYYLALGPTGSWHTRPRSQVGSALSSITSTSRTPWHSST